MATRKSDQLIVVGERESRSQGEGADGHIRRATETSTGQSRAGETMTTALHAIASKARTHPGHRFQDLYGLLDTGLLMTSWGQLNPRAKPGIDGIKVPAYREHLRENVSELVGRLRHGQYRAPVIQRSYIRKANGKQRPLGLPTVGDKLVQQGVSRILQSIWEADFLSNSYGYRPERGAHQAVHSLALNLQYKGYGYIVDADIKGFFEHMDHDWLMAMLSHRIDDRALLRLIGQWLKARVRETDGTYSKPASGTPQGGVLSPVLANIYLHYALDLWFEKVVKAKLDGRAMLIRYADDFVVAFQYRRDAQRFYRTLPKRLNRFGLTVAPEKTHLIRFSRFQPGRRRRFVFLGFEFYWGRDGTGQPRLRRRTAAERQREAMNGIYRWIKRHRGRRLSTWLPTLLRKLRGFQNYFGLPDNSRSLQRLYHQVLLSLHKWLNRRSQRRSYTWGGLLAMLGHCGFQPLRVCRRAIGVDWY